MGNEFNSPAAIILGGEFTSLGFARILAKYDLQVYIIDSKTNISQFSRHVKEFIRSPSIDPDDKYIEFLIQIAIKKGLEGSVVFLSNDEQVRVISQNHSTLSEYYHLIVPSWEVVRYLYDKRLTYQLAIQQGVPVPVTYYPNTIDNLLSRHYDFPLVLKPAISSHLISTIKKKALRANNEEELLEKFMFMSTVVDQSEILIQELIPGQARNLYAYFGLFKCGTPVSGYSAHRLRQHPAEFGRASTYVVTALIPELEKMSVDLLSGIKFSGMAEVEFMYDQKHDRFEFLEVNPRIWGWHMLASFSGVDLPYLVFADAVGEPYMRCDYQEGAKWMRLITDIPTVAVEIWNGRMNLGEYFRSIYKCKDAVFSYSDPLPFIMEIALLPYFALKKGF